MPRVRDKEKVREYNGHYWQAHKEVLLEQRKSYKKAYNRRVKLEVLSYYSSGTPKCARCNIGDVDVLCLDHISGTKTEDRQIISRRGNRGRSRGGVNFYCYLRKNGYPEGYQVLCANCNLKKLIVEGT